MRGLEQEDSRPEGEQCSRDLKAEENAERLDLGINFEWAMVGLSIHSISKSNTLLGTGQMLHKHLSRGEENKVRGPWGKVEGAGH